jgi:hypothetical protein
MPFRIDRVYVFASVDDDQEEGVCAFATTSGGWMPMIAADADRLEQLRPLAPAMARMSGRPVVLLRFAGAGREVLERWDP